MGISAIGLGSAAQAAMSTYTGLKREGRLDDAAAVEKGDRARRNAFYDDLNALFKSWGEGQQPSTAAPTAAALGAQVAGTPAGQMQTIALPATAPIPGTAAPVGYGPGAQPAGLANAVTPMMTRPATGNAPSPYAPDPLLMKRPGLGG